MALEARPTRREIGRMVARCAAAALASAASAASVASVASAARADDAGADDAGDLDAREVIVEGAGMRRRMMLFVPRHLGATDRVPLLVLLHGLGETTDDRLGAHAWSDRYGLVTAYERLRRPPIVRTSSRADWTDARLAEVNASLAARPFRGFVVACPSMPRLASGEIDAYARWLVSAAIPRARSEGGACVADASRDMIGGCSLGGYVSLEIFLRRPELFAAWAGVQTAIGVAAAAAYAARIAKAIAEAGPRALLLETSAGDPFRAANVALATALEARGIPRELRVLPGPHDQPWLREAGTVEALLWADARR